MPVTNIWHVLNLRTSPFFQDPLDPSGVHYPIELFVGRQEEAEQVLSGIIGSSHSRHAIQGPPGVGKTTLVQYIKAEAASKDYLAHADPISLTSALASSGKILLEILASVYDALVAHDRNLGSVGSLQQVSGLLEASLGGGRAAGGSRSAGGGGRYVGQLTTLLRELGEVARLRLKSAGILIHLDNLENLVEADPESAARIIRDLRDRGLMYQGYHFLLVGTDEAIRTVVAGQEQLRSVVSNPGSLRPLGPDEVEELLRRRCDFLRLDEARPWGTPVEPDALREVYTLFQGNLRGTLHALDEAAKVLVGRGDDPSAPMALDRMRPVLHAIYARKMEADLTPTQVGQVRAIGARGVNAPVTQAEMAKLFGASQSATSVAVGELRRKGYLVETGLAPTGGRGRPRQQYALSGRALLAIQG